MNRIALKKLKRMIPLNCLTKTGKFASIAHNGVFAAFEMVILWYCGHLSFTFLCNPVNLINRNARATPKSWVLPMYKL